MVWLGLPVWGEAHVNEHLLYLLLRATQRLDHGVHEHSLDVSQIGLPTLGAGLHKNSPDAVGVYKKAFTELLVMG